MTRAGGRTPAGPPASTGPMARSAAARPSPTRCGGRCAGTCVWNIVAFVGVVVAVVGVSWLVARNEAVRDAEVTARAMARTDRLAAGRRRLPRAGPRGAGEDGAGDWRTGPATGRSATSRCGPTPGTAAARSSGRTSTPLSGRPSSSRRRSTRCSAPTDTVSAISDLEKVENALERPEGELIEVYTGTRDATGAPSSSRSTCPPATCGPRCVSLIRVILPLPILALIALSAWRRCRSRCRWRGGSTAASSRCSGCWSNAVESSDLERRRIAQDLHDGVVQDLAGDRVRARLGGPAAPRRTPSCARAWSRPATSCGATSRRCAP